jgi:hypothetical protein
MAKVDLRNAYYRGWFAARAQRPAPEPRVIEEHFFIDMGIAHGKLSSGEPLGLWSKSIESALPVNPDSERRPDNPLASTRPKQEPSMAPRDEQRPARKHADEKEEVPPAEPAAEVLLSRDADAQGTETLEAQPEKRAPQLPEKKPQHKLPSRSVYSSGKRRPARFAR